MGDHIRPILKKTGEVKELLNCVVLEYSCDFGSTAVKVIAFFFKLACFHLLGKTDDNNKTIKMSADHMRK